MSDQHILHTIADEMRQCAALKESARTGISADWLRQRADALDAAAKEQDFNDVAYHAMCDEARRLEAEIDKLKRLREFDLGTIPLPKGVMLEYARLDGIWQKMVRERREQQAEIERLRVAGLDAWDNEIGGDA